MWLLENTKLEESTSGLSAFHFTSISLFFCLYCAVWIFPAGRVDPRLTLASHLSANALLLSPTFVLLLNSEIGSLQLAQVGPELAILLHQSLGYLGLQVRDATPDLELTYARSS